MNETLNIPEKLKVGFQKRSDTYTGKLSYVTYINKKGKLAKELSWTGWRNKDITPLDIDNVPTEGFVLNKKAGGYSTGWNHRQTYCRVYDPRDFEFEITIDNLLYILQECTSTKGKGLEGQFVYAWSGKDLVLLPVTSPDYQASKKLIESTEKITMKSLKIGASYKSKDSENVVYLGKMIWHTFDYSENSIYKLVSKPHPTFVDITNKMFYSIDTMSKLYFMINDNEMSLSEVEDYKEKFLHTFNGQANLIDKFVLKQNGSNHEYWGGYFYVKYIDEHSGKLYDLKLNPVYKLNGKTYNELIPYSRYGYSDTQFKDLPFKNNDEFKKIADLTWEFLENQQHYFSENNTEYNTMSYNSYPPTATLCELSEEVKNELIKNRQKNFDIGVQMKNGDICKFQTSYRSGSSLTCKF